MLYSGAARAPTPRSAPFACRAFLTAFELDPSLAPIPPTKLETCSTATHPLNAWKHDKGRDDDFIHGFRFTAHVISK